MHTYIADTWHMIQHVMTTTICHPREGPDPAYICHQRSGYRLMIQHHTLVEVGGHCFAIPVTHITRAEHAAFLLLPG